VSKPPEGMMGFELWKTLEISWPVGVGALVAGAVAAGLAGFFVSRRRAGATAPSLRLGPAD
jgi:hypothetical protein